MIETFHFIRPAWLLMILPLLVICGLLLRRHLSDHNWQAVVDEKLLPYLLVDQPNKASRMPPFAVFMTGLLAVLAMAGPSWEKLPQPVFKKQSALLIALDLSRSMDAVDLNPSRLAMARYKILDILARRKEGQTGLIVYAADPYTVSPLTDDAATIAALIPSLSTDIMPAEGGNTSKALNKAGELLNNAGFDRGDILLVTDNIEKAAGKTLRNMRDQGFKVSVLAVGTEDGAPIPLENGGFMKDQQGQVVVTRLEPSRLRSMVLSAGGLFTRLSVDDVDINHLKPLIEISTHKGKSVETEIKTDIWREFGPWLLIPLLPLAALAFRRGYLVLAIAFILPWPQPVSALDLSELFTSHNQRAMRLFEENKFNEAAELFDDKQWKASAYYRARQYQLSIDLLQNTNTAEAHYNRANALTRQDKIGNAITAYNEALKLDPDHEDAKYNKALLEKLQEEQQQEQQQSRNPNQQEEDESKQSEASEGGDAGELGATPGDDEESEASEKPSQNEQQGQSQPGDPGDQEQTNPQNERREEGQQKEQPESQAVQQNDNETEKTEQPDQQENSDQQEELSDQAVEQWLNKVPDDPGGLLRRKFKYLYKKQQQSDG